MADNLQNQFDELIKKLAKLGASTREIDSMKKAFQNAGDSTEQARAELTRMNKELQALEMQAASATLPFQILLKY